MRFKMVSECFVTSNRNFKGYLRKRAYAGRKSITRKHEGKGKDLALESGYRDARSTDPCFQDNTARKNALVSASLLKIHFLGK